MHAPNGLGLTSGLCEFSSGCLDLFHCGTSERVVRGVKRLFVRPVAVRFATEREQDGIKLCAVFARSVRLRQFVDRNVDATLDVNLRVGDGLDRSYVRKILFFPLPWRTPPLPPPLRQAAPCARIDRGQR